MRTYMQQTGNAAGDVEYCSWQEIQELTRKIATSLHDKAAKHDCILAIANGGIIPAKLLAEELGIDQIMLIPIRNKQIIEAEMPSLQKGKKYLVVDDIYDTGDIYQKVARVMQGFDCTFAFCMSRYHQEFGIYGKLLNHKRWIVFPWEKAQA
ncbi:putative phosphoribosyltransferase [Candidatus Nitrososphaera evergladensis SR1]|uniref:Putative phosphoribosyltransferase n=1 Tax=Candidatus Nitrososphaera evergladensis SR1 TaxID=1459636 RepID=A0A075MR51_9ARCH|nr:phosphoribosyltransferase family protein [Candidatus Nitrososphaera evergladensis]AIF83575.1 putative phosphoribosyltransferase [Candidatus Nitrososphaera evergladensis SR1]